MTASASSERPTAWPTVDDYLGPASGRFFGEGYRHTCPRLRDLAVTHRGGASTLDAHGSIHSSHAWSTKDRTPQRPHLATTDVIALTAQAVGALLASRFTPQTAADSLVTDVSVSASTVPLEDDLDRFDVSAGMETATPDGVEHRYSAQVGPITVTGSVVRPLAIESLADLVAPSGIGDAGDCDAHVYGARLALRRQRLMDVRLRDGRVTALSTITESADQVPAHGLEASAQPAYTPVDVFVATLQLGQVLLYELDGLEREASDTLWMRRAEVRTTAALTTAAPRPVEATLERSRIVRREASAWRLADVVGRLGPYRVRTAVAHLVGPSAP